MLDFVPNKDPSVVFNIARLTSQSKDKFALSMNKSTHDVSPLIFLAGVQINQRDLATLLIRGQMKLLLVGANWNKLVLGIEHPELAWLVALLAYFQFTAFNS